MVKYKIKAPAQVEAMKFTAPSDFNQMLAEWGEKFQAEFDVNVAAKTLKFYSTGGLITIPVSGWVIRDANGVFSTMTDTVFNATYSKV